MSDAMTQTDVTNATLIYRKDLTRDLAIFRIKPDGGVPDFTAGQFATIGLPKPEPTDPVEIEKAKKRKGPALIRRAYSIASPPSEKDYLELYVALVEDGQLTPKLWELQDGDRLFCDPKLRGHFTMEDVPDNMNLCMLSTGTGLAPFISMLKQHMASGRWKRFIVLHGVRYQDDLGYRDELENLAYKHKDILYVPALSREPKDSPWKGLRGRIPLVLDPDVWDIYLGIELDPTDTHFFLCGNPGMIDGVTPMLEERGFTIDSKKEPGNIHFERYW